MNREYHSSGCGDSSGCDSSLGCGDFSCGDSSAGDSSDLSPLETRTAERDQHAGEGERMQTSKVVGPAAAAGEQGVEELFFETSGVRRSIDHLWT